MEGWGWGPLWGEGAELGLHACAELPVAVEESACLCAAAAQTRTRKPACRQGATKEACTRSRHTREEACSLLGFCHGAHTGCSAWFAEGQGHRSFLWYHPLQGPPQAAVASRPAGCGGIWHGMAPTHPTPHPNMLAKRSAASLQCMKSGLRSSAANTTCASNHSSWEAGRDQGGPAGAGAGAGAMGPWGWLGGRWGGGGEGTPHTTISNWAQVLAPMQRMRTAGGGVRRMPMHTHERGTPAQRAGRSCG